MKIPRRRAAQVCAAVTAAAIFLPWQTADAEDAGSTLGSGVNEGRIVFIICLVTVGLIQVGWRPAWIGVGFVGAITVRAILDGEADPASGLWIAAGASIVAVVLLVWEMFAAVAASDNSGNGNPGGRGFSGPVGRRRP